ncbi:MAG: DUF721 domain-containing protein [Jatrophihabitans sp.]
MSDEPPLDEPRSDAQPSGEAPPGEPPSGEPRPDELPAAGDLASNALQSARAIATGRARAAGRTGRAARRRRGAADQGGYSGARPDERDPMKLSTLVGRSIGELGWVAPLAEAKVLGQWASVVGADIAARCQPVSLVDGELKIAAESTAWATQLRLMAPQILARIGKELPVGTVRKLVISGPSGPSWKRGPWSMRGGRGVRDTYG